MVDDMVALMKQEQLEDDHKNEYWLIQFDLVDDKKKALGRPESTANLTDETKTLRHGITELDKTIAEATETVMKKL